IGRIVGEEAFVNQLQPKDCIFRINRDIRFSKDKSPYKTTLGTVISPKGRKDKTNLGMYIELSANHLRLYSGVYFLEKEPLIKMRTHLLEHQEKFLKLIKAKAFKNTFGEIRGERNKRIPKPFSEVQESFPYILNKSFYFFKTYDPQLILDPKVCDILEADYQHALPLNTFLKTGLEL
ncbi:MAG: TIGR02453 family protein, partial [Flavobacteriales bacterium]